MFGVGRGDAEVDLTAGGVDAREHFRPAAIEAGAFHPIV
jgi:hypothetical protein